MEAPALQPPSEEPPQNALVETLYDAPREAPFETPFDAPPTSPQNLSSDAVTGLACPKCNGWLDVRDHIGRQGRIICTHCQWSGEVWLHKPLPRQIDHATQALTEDARCVVHPNKKATAVCAGTGDYICSLCAVEVEGKTYNAAFIDQHGKEKIDQHFTREIPRPDRVIIWMLVLCLFPYPVVASPVVVPIGCIRWWRMVKQRQENESYRATVGMTSVVIYGVLLGALALGLTAGIIVLIIALIYKLVS